MSRLFRYELKMLVLNKFFLGLLIITAVYSHRIMSGDIIVGISNTAPFSGWSYGVYLSKMLPILLIALLFFISFLYSKQERKVQALTKATPIDPFRFQMLRCGTIIIAFILISAVPIGYSLWFYKVNFHFTSFENLVLPTAITLLPAMLFIFGVGMLCGRYHEAIIYILMAVVMVLSYLPLPYTLDLFGGYFYTSYPLSIDVVEPAFFIPTKVLIGKLIYGFSGIIMIVIASIQKKVKC